MATLQNPSVALVDADLWNIYDVTKEGDVYSYTKRSRGRLIKGWISSGGHIQVRCYVNGKTSDLLVHRLVAIKYIPNPENKPHINHKDGVKTNNCVDNLEWCTASENLKHAYAIGLTCKKGIKHPSVKLSEDDVLLIRRHTGVAREMAERFCVSISLIHKIKSKTLWRHL